MALASYPLWKPFLPKPKPQAGNPYLNQPIDSAIRLKTGRKSGEDIRTNLGRIRLDSASSRAKAIDKWDDWQA